MEVLAAIEGSSLNQFARAHRISRQRTQTAPHRTPHRIPDADTGKYSITSVCTKQSTRAGKSSSLMRETHRFSRTDRDGRESKEEAGMLTVAEFGNVHRVQLAQIAHCAYVREHWVRLREMNVQTKAFEVCSWLYVLTGNGGRVFAQSTNRATQQ